MKVLLLTRYDRQGASSRVRFLQYLKYLSEADIQVDVRPLFSAFYLQRAYAGKSVWMQVLTNFFSRAIVLAKAGAYDVVWLEKELFPFLPAVGERLLSQLNIPYIVDFDDAIFHRYDQHRRAAVRRILGKKIDVVMRNASLVVAGNDYLAERAGITGARRVEIIPSVVDIDNFGSSSASRNDVVTVGWIGSPSTAKYLKPLAPAFNELTRSTVTPIRFVAVGAGRDIDGLRPFELVDWSEDTEIEVIRSFDIGIMPLENSDWEKGKCGYKLILYMACGLPTVASPIGVNSQIVRHGYTGFLASDLNEWQEFILKLACEDRRRSDMGNRGRETVESWYSVQVQAPRLIRLLLQFAP